MQHQPHGYGKVLGPWVTGKKQRKKKKAKGAPTTTRFKPPKGALPQPGLIEALLERDKTLTSQSQFERDLAAARKAFSPLIRR